MDASELMNAKKSARQLGLKLFPYLLLSPGTADPPSYPAGAQQAGSRLESSGSFEEPSAPSARSEDETHRRVMLNLWVRICRKSSRCHRR